MKKKGLFYVILSGGEPFLYSDINILMKFLIKNNFYIVINTNGTLSEKSDYKDFLLKADEIVVSIDGNNAVNNMSRGKGSLEKILNTLSFLKKNKKKTVLSTVVWKENCNENTLEFFRKLKRKFKVTLDFEKISLKLVPEKNIKKCIPEKNDIIKFCRLLRIYKNKYNWKEISEISIDNIVESRPVLCRSHNYVLYVNNNGDIYPCVDSIGIKELYIGNIQTFRGKGNSEFYCSECKCNTLLNLNNLLSGKPDIKSIFRWLI